MLASPSKMQIDTDGKRLVMVTVVAGCRLSLSKYPKRREDKRKEVGREEGCGGDSYIKCS